MSKNGKTGVNRITGRSAFLALLKDEGITHLFGNPGTTELPIMHALKEHPDLTYVMAMQESLVVAIADGFSRASGRLVSRLPLLPAPAPKLPSRGRPHRTNRSRQWPQRSWALRHRTPAPCRKQCRDA